MRRRSNKSHKVPNVKLRPAQEGALQRLRRTESPACLAEDSQIGSDDTTIVDFCPRPFRGMVICATGVADKPTVFKQAVELGAICVSAFTDRVTHLVAEGHGGAKYQCAVERKIPILQPAWVEACYQVWLRGDDVDLEESIEDHRIPVFSGVVLCISGDMDGPTRNEISRLVVKHGGSYVKNLERPVRVTHLLCAGDEETEKMRYAEKFNERGEANLHLVWEEWFWDSLEFGGRWDELTYRARGPRPEPKKKITEPLPPSSNPDQELEPSSSLDTEPDDTNLPEEEPANIKRLPATTLHVWGNLLGRRGYEVADGALIRSPTKARPPTKAVANEDDEMDNNKSVIAQFRRANSFAPQKVPSESTRTQPFRRTKTVAAVEGKTGPADSFMSPVNQRVQEKRGEGSTLSKSSNVLTLFAGLKFVALGEAKGPVVRKAVEEHGGRIMLGAADEEVDFIIVRLVSGSKLYREELDESQRAKYRTECWLERCIFAEKICPPEDNITFTPIGVQLPIPGAENLTVSFSGLDQSELCWTGRLLRALGINMAKGFSKKSTHLLCPSGSGAKYDKACEWGIPVIKMEWLVSMARTGQVPSGTNYLVSGAVLSPASPTKTPKRNRTLDKGKGRAVDLPPMTRGNTDMDVTDEMPDSALVESFAEDQYPKTPSHPRTQSASQPFGRPTGLLGGAQQITPTRSMSTPVIRTTPQRHPNHAKSQPIPPPSSSRRSQRLTNRDVERERTQVRIPSSTSPSPMRISPRSRSPLKQVSSPVIPEEVTRALHDNIASLLGKRPPPEELATRKGKRPRPRPKGTSRQQSNADMAENFDEIANPFNALDEPNPMEAEPVDDGLHVTYEDPKQREEKLRLMQLLNVTGPGVSDCGAEATSNSGESLRRRSSRIAGH